MNLRLGLLLLALLATVGCASGGSPAPSTMQLPEACIEAMEAQATPQDPSVTVPKAIRRAHPRPVSSGPRSAYVCIHATITTEGLVADPEILATNSNGFAAAMVDALKDARYEPAMRDGEPVDYPWYFTATYKRSGY